MFVVFNFDIIKLKCLLIKKDYRPQISEQQLRK